MARWLCSFALILLGSPPALAGPLSLGIGVAIERGETSGVSGWLRLEVPLDRVAAPRAIAEGPADARADSVGVEQEQRAHPSAPEARPPASRAPLPFRHDTALARALVREALRLRGQSVARDRLDSLAARARASAILPELMLRAARSTDQSLRLTPSGAERYDFTQTGGADLLFEARATWNLDRLVFADDELRVEHLRQAQEDAGEHLALAVLKHLFAWQRARARLASAELEPEKALDLELDALEAEAALDVLTGGLFGRRIASAQREKRRLPSRE